MKRMGCVLVGIAGVLWGLGLASGAGAEVITLDYDDAEKVDFLTTPYAEDGTSTVVDSGHFEVVADAGGADGDQAFNIDEQMHGLSQVTLSLDDGRVFDVVSLEVVNPAESSGEVTISAVGGGAGSISAPTVAGPLNFDSSFQGVSALVITQNAAGAFSFDDVTIQALPEPGALPSWIASLSLLWALQRRRNA